MKRLVMVGGLAALLVAVAASQHSPPAPDQAMVLSAAMAAPTPDLVSAARFDGYVIRVSIGQHILVPATSLSNLEVMPASRPWRHYNVNAHNTLLPNNSMNPLTTRHVKLDALPMRGWGFL